MLLLLALSYQAEEDCGAGGARATALSFSEMARLALVRLARYEIISMSCSSSMTQDKGGRETGRAQVSTP